MTPLRLLARAFATTGMVALLAAASASATPLAHGHVVQIVNPRTIFNASQSNNWFGYGQGTLEQGGKQFHSVAGEWTVPAASAHASAQAAASADWVGIGGGCVDAACNVGDGTLIQTGTEQDVDSAGRPSYSAWWEVVPGPSVTISMSVAPGDRMFASIDETPRGSEVWTITLKDVTRGETFTRTVAYSSSYATAEWIAETPVVIDASGTGIAALPNLSTIPFDHATTNGAATSLSSSEEIDLTDQTGNVIGTPSAPDAESAGFDLCAWSTACPPSSGASTAGATTSRPAASSAAPNRTVCRVPRLVGLRLRAATRALRRAHCRPGRVRRRTHHGRRRGTVLSQGVRAGRTLRAGSRVSMTVER